MQIEMRAVDAIKPYGKNPRLNDGAVAAVAESIKTFGFRQPIVVDKAGVIVCGHTRWRAAQKLGMAKVPVHVADLTDEQVRAYRIADNKTNELSVWDYPLLSEELESLKDIDWPKLGFDQKELDKLLNSNQSGEDADDVPEIPVDPITKPGDLWLLGDHRVLCGDSTRPEDLALVMDGAQAEMMFTDPPYGVAYTGGHFNARKREALAGDEDATIYARFLPVALPFVDGPCYLWFADTKGFEVYAALRSFSCIVSAMIVWHKTNATYAAMNAQYKCRKEPCLYFKPKGSTLRWSGPTDACDLWELKRDPSNDMHPTQKPVELAARAIGNHKAVSVLDPFLGSGSTLIAAEQLGRKCYGIEISPAYCDVIVKRWEAFTGNKAELAPDEGPS